jgi:uncharacterized protein (DUF1330 family)
MNFTNAVFPGQDQIRAFFGGAEDGPFVMVNLLKFKERADYPDGAEPELSGRDAYRRYGAAVQACFASAGARSVYAGEVSGILLGEVAELWDMVALVEYPSRAAMMMMLSSVEYLAIEKHRVAGLAGQLNICTRAIGT